MNILKVKIPVGSDGSVKKATRQSSSSPCPRQSTAAAPKYPLV